MTERSRGESSGNGNGNGNGRVKVSVSDLLKMGVLLASVITAYFLGQAGDEAKRAALAERVTVIETNYMFVGRDIQEIKRDVKRLLRQNVEDEELFSPPPPKP